MVACGLDLADKAKQLLIIKLLNVLFNYPSNFKTL